MSKMLIFLQTKGLEMPKFIPVAVRKKIVSAYEKGKMTQVQIAEIFDTTNITVCRFVQRSRKGDDLAVKKGTGRPSPMNEEGLKKLKEIVLSEPDKTLMEYCSLFEKKTGIYISRSAMDRFIKKLNFRRKKKSLYAQEQDRPDVKKKRRLYVRIGK